VIAKSFGSSLARPEFAAELMAVVLADSGEMSGSSWMKIHQANVVFDT